MLEMLMNTPSAKENMIKQQLKALGVSDERLLAAFQTLPREDFVPESQRTWAYADISIPLAHGDRLWTPSMEGRVLQALNIQPHEVVLEIGTGSGYLTALIAKLAIRVVTIDKHPEQSQKAEQTLSAHGLNHVVFHTGDASRDWVSNHLYDVIVITGALPVPPKTYLDQLTVNGRLFVVHGIAPAMKASCFTRTGDRSWEERVLFETCLPYLS